MNIPGLDRETLGEYSQAGSGHYDGNNFGPPPGGEPNVDPQPTPDPTKEPRDGELRRRNLMDPGRIFPPRAPDFNPDRNTPFIGSGFAPEEGMGFGDMFGSSYGGFGGVHTMDIGPTASQLGNEILSAGAGISRAFSSMFGGGTDPTGAPGPGPPTPQPPGGTVPMDGGHHAGTISAEGVEVIEEEDLNAMYSDPTWFQSIFGLHWWGPANSLETTPSAAYKYAVDNQDSLKAQFDYAGYAHDFGVEQIGKEYSSGVITYAQAVELLQENDKTFVDKIDGLYYHRNAYADGSDILPWLMKHISPMVMSPLGQVWQRKFLAKETSPPRKYLRYSTGAAPPKARKSALVTSPLARRDKREMSRVAKDRYKQRYRDTSRWVGPPGGDWYSRKRDLRTYFQYHDPKVIDTRRRKRKRVRFNV